MKLKEKFEDLKLLFKVIGWYKENKDVFYNIGNYMRSLQSQVNQLRDSLAVLKADKAVKENK
jgi:hypothetical protein